jgi:hypothetical protein
MTKEATMPQHELTTEEAVRQAIEEKNLRTASVTVTWALLSMLIPNLTRDDVSNIPNLQSKIRGSTWERAGADRLGQYQYEGSDKPIWEACFHQSGAFELLVSKPPVEPDSPYRENVVRTLFSEQEGTGLVETSELCMEQHIHKKQPCFSNGKRAGWEELDIDPNAFANHVLEVISDLQADTQQ